MRLRFRSVVGATTILMAERATPQAVFQRLVEAKPTIFCGVPTLYAAMLAVARIACARERRAAPVHLGG